jgi:hypothetical protein
MDFLFFIMVSHPLHFVARGATSPCGAAHIIFLTFVRIVFNKEAGLNIIGLR